MESWNGKPYHSFDYMLKERFSCKIYKTALNGGMTCPNRDGTLGTGAVFSAAREVREISPEISGILLPSRSISRRQNWLKKETPLPLSPIFRLTPIPMPLWNTWRNLYRSSESPSGSGSIHWHPAGLSGTGSAGSFGKAEPPETCMGGAGSSDYP